MALNYFVNMTEESGIIKRNGRYANKSFDLTNADQVLDYPIVFSETDMSITPVPEEGFVGKQAFLHDSLVDSSSEPYTWVLAKKVGIVEELKTRLRVLVVGDYLLVCLIKGRVFFDLQDEDGNYIPLDRNYGGKRDSIAWFDKDSFRGLNNNKYVNDGLFDFTISYRRYFKGYEDYSFSPTNEPVLFPIFDAETKAAIDDEKQKEIEDQKRILKEKEELREARREEVERRKAAKKAKTSKVSKGSSKTSKADGSAVTDAESFRAWFAQAAAEKMK